MLIYNNEISLNGMDSIDIMYKFEMVVKSEDGHQIFLNFDHLKQVV